jgi:hypothetical protein
MGCQCIKGDNTGENYLPPSGEEKSFDDSSSLMMSNSQFDTDSYADGSVISHGIFSSDPNYSSSTIGIEDFSIIKVIGRGSFGKVYLVRKKDDGCVFAMKTLKKDMILRKNQTTNTKGKSLLQSTTNLTFFHRLVERMILERLNHPFIVKLHYAF